jgi:hypothetical protein
MKSLSIGFATLLAILGGISQAYNLPAIAEPHSTASVTKLVRNPKKDTFKCFNNRKKKPGLISLKYKTHRNGSLSNSMLCYLDNPDDLGNDWVSTEELTSDQLTTLRAMIR